MLILKHNELPAQDMFVIERHLVRWLDNNGPKITPNWHVLELNRTDLYGHLLGIFATLKVFDTLRITPSQLLDFLVDVDIAYLHTPYHSFYHAADIAMMLYYILMELDGLKQLESMDMASLLIAALCHDMGHPGYNNLYQVNSKTPLAQKYNNTSVLENYSVDITHDLLNKHKLFDNVSYDWKDSIKRLILSTDMVYHYELQEKAGALEEIMGATWTDNGDDGGDHGNDDIFTGYDTNENDDFLNSHDCNISTTSITKNEFRNDDDMDDEDEDGSHNSSDTDSQWFSEPPTPTVDQLLDQHFSSTSPSTTCNLSASQCHDFCRIILHAADISNTVRPWPISKQWSDLIVQEFFQQGDAEKQAGLAISPGMDRDASHQATISLKFGDFVVRPYFEALAGVLPKSRVFLTTLAENRMEWMQLKDSPMTMMTLTSPPPPQERHFPSRLLPPVPVPNPAGRRVSVPAGLVIIPDRYRRRYWHKHHIHQRWSNHKKRHHFPSPSPPSPPSTTTMMTDQHRITKPMLSPLQHQAVNRFAVRSVSQPVILPDLIFHHSDTTKVIGTTSQVSQLIESQRKASDSGTSSAPVNVVPSIQQHD
ncbi:hypothetical protein BCR42DRAFT_457417 [Absidia repens]|uniref:Phosphodiesterase n=1 Tax=Absidia repens TaxID=90262 RepID=A0A1X2HL09_9FUNG|nr:hypothetical protein BCR42DRAFT_457417 [Absidia repens]